MTAFEAQGVRKTYGGVVALHGADFAVRPGSVHALLGENGAGKSTLVKVMTGAVRPDSGTVRLDGDEVSFKNTADAVSHGVAVVAQELSLFPHLDILANLFPMREPRRGPLVDRRRMLRSASPVLAQLGIEHHPSTLISQLSLADRQLVEIGKALVAEPRVLLLDEPTSALETGASERLLGILRVLRDRNVAVVYVSHILEEVMRLCDEVTVLRDGHVVMRGEQLADLSLAAIVAAMLGHETQRTEPAADVGVLATERRAPMAADATPAALVLDGVSSRSGLKDVSLRVTAGEVVGLAGLQGSGPEAVLSAIAGTSKISAGEIRLPGGQARPSSFREAIDRGVAFVSGDRRRLGLMLDKPIWENIVQVRTMGMARDGALLRPGKLRERAAGLAARAGRQNAVGAPSTPAISLVATSRRSSSPSGWTLRRPPSCSTTLLVASTSVPARRSTRSCAQPPQGAPWSCSCPRTSRSWPPAATVSSSSTGARSAGS